MCTTGSIRWTKVVLPSAVGVLIAVLAVAPLEKKGDVSFILDKKKVQNAQERMRIELARYVGSDNKGQKFEIAANNALQRSSDVPIVDIQGMSAQLAMEQGPLMIGANNARYNLDTQQVAIDGPGAGLGPGRIPPHHPRRDRGLKAAANWPAPVRSPGKCASVSSRPASSKPTLAAERSCSTAVLA